MANIGRYQMIVEPWRGARQGGHGLQGDRTPIRFGRAVQPYRLFANTAILGGCHAGGVCPK